MVKPLAVSTTADKNNALLACCKGTSLRYWSIGLQSKRCFNGRSAREQSHDFSKHLTEVNALQGEEKEALLQKKKTTLNFTGFKVCCINLTLNGA